MEDTTVNVWEDNWDDDAKEDDFANQLRLEQFLCPLFMVVSCSWLAGEN